MTEDTTKFGVSRRTLAKGAAWSVPAAAVVAAAPAYAASPVPPPPPPVFDWGSGCATVGTGNGGCNGQQKTAQVPVFIKNFSGQTLQFQIVGAKLWNSNDTEPGNFSTPQLWTNNGFEDRCGPQITATGCGGYPTVTLAHGECKRIWIVGANLQNAAAFWAKFRYRWVTPPVPGTPPTGCEVVGQEFYLAEPDEIIPRNNCDAQPVTDTNICAA